MSETVSQRSLPTSSGSEYNAEDYAGMFLTRQTMIQITDQAIDCAAVLQSVYDENCGANLLFSGTTRRNTGDQQTEFLVYECYREMAIKEMERLADLAKSKWPVKLISVTHRIGKVDVGEISIVIAVSGPHRKETFAAGEWLIDELKKKVPIWKQENGVDGSQQWVHPGVQAEGAETK